MYVCMCVCYVCIFFNQIQKKNTNSDEIQKFTNDFAATVKNSLKYEEFRWN
jgi:hypothetical protein